MKIGEQIKYLRQLKKLGVNQLALKAGLDGSQISRIESGKSKKPEFNTVKNLANALGVPLTYFNDKAENRDQLEVAAHIWEDITQEQLTEIIHFIDYVKQRDEEKQAKKRQ